MSSAKRIHNEEKMALGSAGGQREGLGELGKGKPRDDAEKARLKICFKCVLKGTRGVV